MKGYTIVEVAGQSLVKGLDDFRNMIYAFFKRSLRDGNEWFQDIDSTIFNDIYTKTIDAILEKPDTIVRLAVLPDDITNCLGWAIYEGKTLHYVFVKTGIGAREHGIATDLTSKEFNKITHLTKTGRIIWKKKFPHVKFDLFLT